MDDYLKDVAIIGAGLGGCALALALTDLNIYPTIYESRPEISDIIPSGVVLTPNGLQVLDDIGVFSRIKDKCYVPQARIFKNRFDETTKSIPTKSTSAGARFEYQNYRIWRKTLFDEMRTMLRERGVKMIFNAKFNGIVSDPPLATLGGNGPVSFLINSTPHTASLLLGADGISSTVRQHIAPGISPSYTGLVGILCHIPRSSVSWPYASYESNATIQDVPGAIFWIAEDPAGEDLMIGKQVQYPQQSRTSLAELQKDREKLAGFYLKDYEAYGETARKIIDSVCRNKDKLYIWPYMKMPELPRWFSESGRVLLLGDGAHALPPSSGQGVNQALEDVYSLTTLLDGLRKREDVTSKVVLEGLALWQNLRQERLDAIFEWTNNASNVSRLPEAERKKLVDEGKVKENQFDDLSWLHESTVYDEIRSWIDGNH